MQQQNKVSKIECLDIGVGDFESSWWLADYKITLRLKKIPVKRLQGVICISWETHHFNVIFSIVTILQVNLQEREHKEGLGVDGRTVLELTLNK